MITKNDVKVFQDKSKVKLDDFVTFTVEREASAIGPAVENQKYSIGARLEWIAVTECNESDIHRVNEYMSKKIMHSIYGQLLNEVGELCFMSEHSSRKEVIEKSHKIMNMITKSIG